jgi:hypothetical protein
VLYLPIYCDYICFSIESDDEELSSGRSSVEENAGYNETGNNIFENEQPFENNNSEKTGVFVVSNLAVDHFPSPLKGDETLSGPNVNSNNLIKK